MDWNWPAKAEIVQQDKSRKKLKDKQVALLKKHESSLNIELSRRLYLTFVVRLPYDHSANSAFFLVILTVEISAGLVEFGRLTRVLPAVYLSRIHIL